MIWKQSGALIRTPNKFYGGIGRWSK